MKTALQFAALTKSLFITAAIGAVSVGCSSASSDSTEGSSALASPDLAAAQESWREAISAAPSAAEGCFEATFPSTVWVAADCVTAPKNFSKPPTIAADGINAATVGNGNDYAAESKTKISATVGTFPAVTVKTETDDGSNIYSIQLNSNFMSGTKACNGVAKCQSWSQFVYSSSETSAFIQDWLIGIGTCPSSAWNDDGQGDCYKNSAAVTVPKLAIADLSTMKMSGTATSSKDSLVFTAEGKAYSTSQADSVTNLSTAWTSSEFNIIGDGGGSAATFGKGTSIEVKVALTNGSTTAPTCESNGGTTGETNNLTAGTCKATSGTSPYIEFTEKN